MWQVTGTKRADFTLSLFKKLSKVTMGRVEAEVERVATLRRAAD